MKGKTPETYYDYIEGSLLCVSHMGFPICDTFHPLIKEISGIVPFFHGIQIKVAVEGKSGSAHQLAQSDGQKHPWLSRADAQMPEPGAHLLHHLAAAPALLYE